MAEESGCFDLLVDEDFFIDFDPSILSEFPPVEDFVRSSPDSWIGEIENQLMNDDNNHDLDQESSISDFLADIFVDSPTGPVDLATDVFTVESLAAEKETEDSEKEKKSNDSGSEIQDGDKVESEIEGDNDDAVAKKRRRRVRNRDAAVRSRERKKEYVQDLEKKSNYLERECLRLGRMLECFVAENQSLRLCLQKGNGNNISMSTTKQESAVLLLESLLLGSLLWFLLGVNIICQFPHLSHTKCYLLRLEPEKLVLSGLGSSTKPSNTGVSRRCKGSRPRMKHQILTLVV